MRKIAYLRIGYDKAGTVTLASLADANKDIFMANGIYAPMRNSLTFYDYLVKKNQIQLDNIFRPPQKKHIREKWRLGMEDLTQNYESYADANIFLTTEVLWGRLTKIGVKQNYKAIEKLIHSIRDFFYHHEVKIILNLRRSDLYFESLYKQVVKSGRFFSIESERFQAKINNRPPVNYISFLTLLGDTFGKQNIIVRPFEKAQLTDNDLISDTMKILGQYDNMDQYEISYGNEGLHRDLWETLLILNQEHGKLLDNRTLLEINNTLKKQHQLKDVKYIYSLSKRDEIEARYSNFYAYVSENFYDHKPVFVEEYPDDSHLEYRLTKENFELVKGIIFERKNEIDASKW